MSKADDKLKRKTLFQIIVGAFFGLLLFVLSIMDALNPFNFFTSKESSGGSETSMASGNLSRILLIILLLFFVFSFIFAVIGFTKKRSSYENRFLKFSYDSLNIANVIPIFLSLFMVVDLFFLSSAVVSGDSMEPTFYGTEEVGGVETQSGDRILISHFSNSLEDGDVIIIGIESDTYIIKRIVASGGDHLRVSADGIVTVNGIVIEDGSRVIDCTYDKVLEEGEYYVLGDNRDVSIDSRNRGIFTQDQIYGKVIGIVLPFSHFTFSV